MPQGACTCQAAASVRFALVLVEASHMIKARVNVVGTIPIVDT